MIRSFDEIYSKISSSSPARMAVVNARNSRILDAIEVAESKGWIIPIYISDRNDLFAAEQAVNIVKSGRADLIMKGDISTSILIQAVIDKVKGIRKERRLSHVAVLETVTYPRLMLFTDGGVNTKLDQGILQSIIENAIYAANKLECKCPNIALLSLTEVLKIGTPEFDIVNGMLKLYENNVNTVIEGPISLDVALSKENSILKNLNSKIAGQTDIFVGQNITTINFIVKSLLQLGNAKGGGIVLGGTVPIVLLSRSDTKETKLNSIALGVNSL
ncbi:MAG: phosphate acyltransferase [Fidelibacterota bacterium]